MLHRHFADFDAFLADLVLDRIARVDAQGGALRETAGTGTVVGNLTGVLTDLFGAVELAIVGLVTSRVELRVRLRRAGSTGIPILTEATAMIASYLAAERELGRIAADAEVDTLALMVVGSGHLLFTGQEGVLPDAAAVDEVVSATVVGVVREPPR